MVVGMQQHKCKFQQYCNRSSGCQVVGKTLRVFVDMYSVLKEKKTKETWDEVLSFQSKAIFKYMYKYLSSLQYLRMTETDSYKVFVQYQELTGRSTKHMGSSLKTFNNPCHIKIVKWH